LSIELMTFFRTNKAAQVFPELRCTFSGRSIVPDLSIFRTSRIPKDANGEVANTFEIAPDWVIEILSPNQSQTRVIRNILHCLSSGTELGWLVDPDEACVFAYTSNQSVQIFDEAPNAFQSSLPVPTFAQALQLTPHDVFSWLQI
ncbi:MAG: Uma2 family endonuclease, partial [Elainellaceae cyanobacterium]